MDISKKELWIKNWEYEIAAQKFYSYILTPYKTRGGYHISKEFKAYISKFLNKNA